MTTEKNDAKTGSDRPATCNASQSVDGVEPSATRGEVVLLFPGRAENRGESDVERINQYAFYELGKLFKQFTATDSDVAAARVFFEVLQARTSLVRLIRDGVPLHLGLSRGPAREFLETLDRIYDAHFTEVKDGKQELRFPDAGDPPIPSWRWSAVAHALERFENVFKEEMREATTYFVPSRGIYRTTALIDEADKTFPAEVVGHIPPKALVEWQGAGRCLAFNLLSASGFHVARAVESVMESYYQFYSGKPGKTLNNWNDYVKELEKIVSNKPTPCPKEKTLAELRQMKDDYRNPIMHPRVVLTEPDARMLFSNGESLIIAMAQELGEATAVQPQLALVQPAAPAQIAAPAQTP